jgi:hypothetical protein
MFEHARRIDGAAAKLKKTGFPPGFVRMWDSILSWRGTAVRLTCTFVQLPFTNAVLLRAL